MSKTKEELLSTIHYLEEEKMGGTDIGDILDFLRDLIEYIDTKDNKDDGC